jgi:hypothetical protein
VIDDVWKEMAAKTADSKAAEAQPTAATATHA